MNRRLERVNVLVREEISRILFSELKDPRLSSIISITHVDTSPDLKSAKVYVSVLGDENDKINTLAAFKSAGGFIHRTMRKNITLKDVPFLRFHLDESIEKGTEMLEYIKEVVPPLEENEGEL